MGTPRETTFLCKAHTDSSRTNLPQITAGIFAAGFLILLTFATESPRILVKQGRRREAKIALRKLRGGAVSGRDLEQEMVGIETQLAMEQETKSIGTRELPVILESVHNEEKFQLAMHSLLSTSHAILVRHHQHHRLRAAVFQDPWNSRQPGETAVHRDHRNRQARSSSSLRSLRRRSNWTSEIASIRCNNAAGLHFLHRRGAVRRPGARVG